MTLYELYNCSVSIQYKNTLCSKATFFVLVTTLIALIFPLFLSYRARGFWLKNYIFYEQPDVHFKYQYLFIIETDDLEYLISCGNLQNTSKLLTLNENCYYFKVREIDHNFDKKIDEIYLELHVKNPLLKNIQNIKFMLVLDYKLDGICPLQMESLIAHEQSFGLPIVKYFVSANLHWMQVTPLPCLHNYKDVRFNYSIVADKNYEVDNFLENVLYTYSRRNVSTTLTNQYTSKLHGNAPVFKMEVSIGIPEHPIRYKPGIWQELKFTWQQYLSIAVVFYFILFKIKGYVFNNRLLPVWKNDPFKKNC
ncbi:transmembrane protein 231 isoform X2 [Arctopsyche grandis]